MKGILSNINILLLLALSVSTSSCKKYLDAKPDVTLETLTSLEEAELLLDSYGIMNTSMTVLADVASDNYYLTSDNYNSIAQNYQSSIYLWKKIDIPTAQWKFEPVLYANVVLDELVKIGRGLENAELYDRLKGTALFHRGFHHFSLAGIFAQPYVKQTAATDLGLPIRTTSDYNVPSVRSSVAETFNSIIADLKAAVDLLPATVLVKTRPAKAAAYGILARIYLAMQEYDSSLLYSDKYLALHNELLDLNVITEDYSGAASSAPFKRFNREIIFHARTPVTSPLLPSRAKVDSILYNSYDVHDLRKKAYFKANTGAAAGTYAFKGDYDGSGTNSGYSYLGIVTDEQYLIRAESHARLGHLPEALADLNALLRTRWETGYFADVTAGTTDEAIDIIILERWKELYFRGLRWLDLRRLMQDSQRAVIPKRIINGQEYQLTPGSTDYTLWIPSNVITLSGIQQNP